MPILSFCIFLFGCPSDKEEPKPEDDRETITKQVSISTLYFPNTLNCGESFEIEKVKVTLRKPKPNEVSFTGNTGSCTNIKKPSNSWLRIQDRVALEMDISKYKGIRTIAISAEYTNVLGLNKPSEVQLYDFDGNLIDRKSLGTDFIDIRFTGNLDNARSIVFVGNAEVTDISTVYLLSI